VLPEVWSAPARPVVAAPDERPPEAAEHVPRVLLQLAAGQDEVRRTAALRVQAAAPRRAALVEQCVLAVSLRLAAARRAPVAWRQREVARQAVQASVGVAPARLPEVSQEPRQVALVALYPAFQVQRPGQVQHATE
jgi:hypothetical protein